MKHIKNKETDQAFVQLQDVAVFDEFVCRMTGRGLGQL
jgi:hypothetical protein